jgi:transposase
MNPKLHAVCDGRGPPMRVYLSAGQTSDYIGAAGLVSGMPLAKVLLADRGHDADWFCNALIDMVITQLCCTDPVRDSFCAS